MASTLSNSTTMIARQHSVPKLEKLFVPHPTETLETSVAASSSPGSSPSRSPSRSSSLSSPHSPHMIVEDHDEPLTTQAIKRDIGMMETKTKEFSREHKRAVPNNWMDQDSSPDQHRGSSHNRNLPQPMVWKGHHMQSEEDYYLPHPFAKPSMRHAPIHTLAPIGNPNDYPVPSIFSPRNTYKEPTHFNQSDYQVAQVLVESSRGASSSSRGGYRPPHPEARYPPYEECQSFEYGAEHRARQTRMDKQTPRSPLPPSMREFPQYHPRPDPFFDAKQHSHSPLHREPFYPHMDTHVPTRLLQAEYPEYRPVRNERRPRMPEFEVEYTPRHEDPYYNARRVEPREEAIRAQQYHDQRSRVVPRASFSPPLSPALSPSGIPPLSPFVRPTHDIPSPSATKQRRMSGQESIASTPSPSLPNDSHLVPSNSPRTPPATPSTPATPATPSPSNPPSPGFTIENFNVAPDGSKLAPHPKNPVKFEFKDFKENEYNLHSLQNSAGGSTLLTLKQQKRHKRIINRALAQGQARARALKAAEEAKKATEPTETESQPTEQKQEKPKTNKRKSLDNIKKEVTEDEPQSKQKVHCICKKPETDSMVQCDSCDMWYHFECVGLTESMAQEIVHYNCADCKGRGTFAKKARADQVDDETEVKEELDVPSTSSSPANVPDLEAASVLTPKELVDARPPMSDELDESDDEGINMADGVISISSLAKQPWLDGWVTARNLAVRYLMEAKRLGYEISENRRLPKQISVRMSGKNKRTWRQAEILLAVQFLKASDLVETSTKKGTIVREPCKTMDDLIAKVQSIAMPNSNNIGKLRVVEFARIRGEERVQD